MKQLRAWIDRNAPGRIVKLAYFGVFPPEDYGLRVESIGEEALMTKPAPGLYAVSAHGVARMPAEAAAIPWVGETWLQRLIPVAIVGHSYYIYDVK